MRCLLDDSLPRALPGLLVGSLQDLRLQVIQPEPLLAATPLLLGFVSDHDGLRLLERGLSLFLNGVLVKHYLLVQLAEDVLEVRAVQRVRLFLADRLLRWVLVGASEGQVIRDQAAQLIVAMRHGRVLVEDHGP